MPEQEHKRIEYRVGNMVFIVTPVYKEAQGESVAAILLKLMQADAQRV